MTAERPARWLRRRTALAGPALAPARHGADVRCRLLVCGTALGVGFRPFVWRLATAAQRTGAVRNTGGGMEIDIEGPRRRLPRTGRARTRAIVAAAQRGEWTRCA